MCEEVRGAGSRGQMGRLAAAGERLRLETSGFGGCTWRMGKYKKFPLECFRFWRKQGTRSRAGNGYSEGGVGDLRIRKGVKHKPRRVDEWADEKQYRTDGQKERHLWSCI